MPRNRPIILWLLSLLLFVMPALAQDDLGQAYVSADERLTVRYPSDWHLQEEEGGLLLIGTSEDTLDITGNETLPAGEAAVAIIPPGGELVDVLGDDPISFLNTFVDVYMNATDQRAELGEPTVVTVGDYSGAMARGTINGNDFLILVLDLGEDNFALIIGVTAPGELARFEPKMLAIVESLRYAPPPPPQGNGINLFELAPITTDHAGELELLSETTVHEGAIITAAISPDGSTVVSGGEDGHIVLWDVAAGTVRATLSGHVGTVEQVLFTPDGDTVVSIGDDGSLRLWDVATGEERERVDNGQHLFYIVISPSGRWLGYTSYLVDSRTNELSSSSVWLLDMQTLEEREIITLDHNRFGNSVAFSPDNDVLMFSASDSENPKTDRINVWMWEIERDREIGSAVHNGIAIDVMYTPDGRALATLNTADNDLVVWDVDQDEILFTLTGFGNTSFHTTLTTDGSIMGTSTFDGAVRLWDIETGDLLATLRHDSPAYWVAFSNDGRLVVTTDDSGNLYLWGIRRETI